MHTYLSIIRATILNDNNKENSLTTIIRKYDLYYVYTKCARVSQGVNMSGLIM